jgi:phage-related protein
VREIRFYQTWSGRSPVGEFLRGLSDREQEKIAWVFKTVRQSDRVSSKYLKKLADTDQLWEIRAEWGRRAFRLLGFFDGNQLIVLVSAFAKQSEQTPIGEIRTAEERRSDYFRRKG